MKTITALEAKNVFGKFLEAAQREPVAVTKNGREVAAMFSINDLTEMADSFLAEPIKANVKEGHMNIVDALMMQTRINKRLDASRRDIAEGKGIVADEAYFNSLRERAKARNS